MSTPRPSVEPQQTAIANALEFMWTRHRPQILERVAVVEAAAAAVAANNLSASDREAARGAAHKLAGTLGMFNLARGTEIARKLELAYSRESAPPPASSGELASAVAELRAMIENRKPGN